MRLDYFREVCMNNHDVFEQADSTLNELGQIKNTDALQANPSVNNARHKKTTLEERFTWLADIDDKESEVNWIWKGFLAPGLVTLLSGNPKEGKTTFLVHLCMSLENGEAFLEQPIKPVKTLIISEEGKNGWYRKKLETKLSGSIVGIIPRYLYDKNHSENWVEAIHEVKELCLGKDIKLVVFDTLSYFWTVNDENQASAVQASLKPLHILSDAGIAVLLIHHDRKSGGGNIVGTRGSSALTGFIDIKMGLRKASGSQRVLESDGRYEETPSKIIVELVEEDGEKKFVVIDKDQVGGGTHPEGIEKISSYIPVVPEGITIGGITKKWIADKKSKPPHQATLSRWLNSGLEDGLVEIVGKLDVKGKPDLWGRTSDTNEETEEDDFEPTS